MILAIITLLTSLVISSVAIFYSVSGLAAIFSGAVVPILVMGTALEVGKLVAASWLHTNWRTAPLFLKSYLSVAVIVLMLITSMGIFGFLSKAHIDQTVGNVDTTVAIQLLDNKIAREESKIKDAETVLNQLDQAVQALTDAQRIRGKDGALAVRDSQKDERAQLTSTIDEAQNNLAQLQDEKSALTIKQAKIEAEVGPIKYIAAFLYGSNPNADLLERAVTYVILIIIFVFDPLAVLLLIASQMSFRVSKEKKIKDTLKEEVTLVPATTESTENITVKEEHDNIVVPMQPGNKLPDAQQIVKDALDNNNLVEDTDADIPAIDELLDSEEVSEEDKKKVKNYMMKEGNTQIVLEKKDN